MRPWSSGYCLGRMYTNHVCWSDRAPGQTGVGAPRTGYPTVYLPPSWTAGPREELVPSGYFSLAFFSRICSKNIHECATLYLVNEIDFGNSDAGFVIITPKLPRPESFRSIRALFQTRGHFGAIPAVFLRIRLLISTNLVETRALRTIFFNFFTEHHHYGKGWWD